MILLKNMAWDVFNAYCINFLSNGYTGSYLHSSCIIWAARLLRWAPVGKARLEFCRIFKMEIYAEMVTGWKPLAIFFKNSILDVGVGSGYVPVLLTETSFYTPLKHQKTSFLFFQNETKNMKWFDKVSSTLPWQMTLSYRNQSIDLPSKYSKDLRHERVKFGIDLTM